jgi:uncharacterized protein (TIGR02646 family)
VRLIYRSLEPNKLTEYRASGARYSDGMDPEYRTPLVEQLLVQQRFRCAYCEANLQNRKAKIEHWATQSLHPELDLAYSNLLAVCYGDLFCGTDLHCDRSRKEKTDLVLDPCRPDHIAQLYYRTDGRLVSDNSALFFDIDSNERLNLNCRQLVRRRQQLLATFRLSLTKMQKRGKRINLHRILAKQEESRDSFNGIVLWYLRKKISQHG